MGGHVRPCPNGHQDPVVIGDAGAGTGERCGTCGAWLNEPPDRWGIFPLVAVLIALALTAGWAWYVFLR